MSIARPGDAVDYLRQHLKPVPVLDPQQLARWIADLDSEVFAQRQEAEESLDRAGDQAGPALRKSLAGSLSLEARRRIERLLHKLEPPAVLTGEPLRTLRAVQVLEGVNSAAAVRLLQELARGGAGAQLTDEAAAALTRLGQRDSSVP